MEGNLEAFCACLEKPSGLAGAHDRLSLPRILGLIEQAEAAEATRRVGDGVAWRPEMDGSVTGDNAGSVLNRSIVRLNLRGETLDETAALAQREE